LLGPADGPESASLDGVTGRPSHEDLVEETIALRGRDLSILRPRDSEALLDEQAFDEDEFLPYWAELWPSGPALARALAGRALRGARTLELGCGLGLPSITAALAGGRVLATDWSPDAVALAAENARRNGAPVETMVCSWTQPAAILARAPWDLVLASDVLYEARNADALLDLLPRLVGDGGEIWIADPGRAPARGFLERADRAWTRRSVAVGTLPQGAIHRLRRRAVAAGAPA
jgi:predicted nicotinamide N-methyase